MHSRFTPIALQFIQYRWGYRVNFAAEGVKGGPQDRDQRPVRPGLPGGPGEDPPLDAWSCAGRQAHTLPVRGVDWLLAAGRQSVRPLTSEGDSPPAGRRGGGVAFQGLGLAARAS